MVEGVEHRVLRKGGRDFGTREGLAKVICWPSSFSLASGRKQRPKTQPNPKSQARRIRKEPPAYAAGMLSVGSFVGSSSRILIFVVDKGMMCQSITLRKQVLGHGFGVRQTLVEVSAFH